MSLVVSPFARREPAIEVVEHKGIGHPDTICDALAEELSRSLGRWYVRHAGTVLHHNVDKALLVAGDAAPRYGGGDVRAPMAIHLAGRATLDAGGARVPVEELAIEASRAWLRANLHALDADRDVDVRCQVRPGSAALVDLFGRAGASAAPPANDTSFGVGYAPLSRLERVVLAAADALRAMARDPATPHVGEDVKVLGVREGTAIRLTVACAFVAAHVRSRAAYLELRDRLARDLDDVARRVAGGDVAVVVNAADDPAHDQVYLTVTGTSAESADDGQVGRGNRVNRLITPCRPMSLEAAAGKNPVTHVGKLYQLAAHAIADAVVREVPAITDAECLLVSEIGRAIDDPRVAEVRVASRAPLDRADTERVRAIAADVIRRIPAAWRDVIDGRVTLY